MGLRMLARRRWMDSMEPPVIESVAHLSPRTNPQRGPPQRSETILESFLRILFCQTTTTLSSRSIQAALIPSPTGIWT